MGKDFTRDEILAEWDRAVDDLAARTRQGVKAKLRDLLDAGVFETVDINTDVNRRPYYIPRLVFWLWIMDQYKPLDSCEYDVKKLQPHV